MKCTRSSSQTRKVINYAQLNDSLCDEDDYSPLRKKPKSIAPGPYPLNQRIHSYNVQKRCHLTRKDKELDLEQIMDEADKDKLPDLVINKGTSSDSVNKLDLFHGKTLKTPNLPVPRHVTRSSLLS